MYYMGVTTKMARYSDKARDEVPDRRSDDAQRRTKPADHRPYSQKAIEALCSKEKQSISEKDWHHKEHQEN